MEENRRGDQGGEVVVRNDNTPTDISIIYLAGVVRAPLRLAFPNALSKLIVIIIFISMEFDDNLCERYVILELDRSLSYK